MNLKDIRENTKKEFDDMNLGEIKDFENLLNRDYSNTVGIIVQKSGVKLYENYFNGFIAEQPIQLYSVTKSIFSALMGIAIDKGYINNLDQKVLDYFPEYTVQAGETTIQRITIRDMLTMTAPYKYETEPYQAYFESDNRMETALDLLGGDGQIGEFLYAAIIGPHILSGILVKATGQSVFDFAVENLFQPLGIQVKHNVMLRSEEDYFDFIQNMNISGWAADRQGINSAAWGLTLTTADKAKIGQLYLNGGKWDGKQIIPAKWVAESTMEHSRWKENDLPYGYLWWIINDKERSYAAMGDGGNVIYVNSAKELVITISSLFVPDAKDRLELILTHIEPIFTA